ncbi:conserved hypothetical protein [Candidatus Terasakiella magnetica]|nr:conserved hypothetical protein [Candidatus Terasakiella magnetica]
MPMTGAVVLIDCENLTSPRQLAEACRWRGFGRVELFGREARMAPWRCELGLLGLAAAAETVVADDAPSQAADQEMSRRTDTLTTLVPPPALIVIASNDLGFDADIRRLSDAGYAASRQGDLSDPEVLRLIMGSLCGQDGWAAAGGVGDHLFRRFGIHLRGRLDQLAAAAGVVVERGKAGVRLGLI